MADTTTPTNARRRRLARLALSALLVLAAVAAVTAIVRSRGDDPVDHARSALEHEAEFDSSEEAVQSFAGVYQDLADATKDCEPDEGRCRALRQAAAWSLTFSPASGHCTQPAIQRGRIALLQYLRAADALDDDATAASPLPPIPSC